MAVAGGGRSSEPGPGSVPGSAGNSSFLGSATTWPLKRYGRFLPPKDGDDEGQNTSSWKVFESSEESGHLILTIVVSGHFFISQGRTVLEGFSLIDSHKWLKIVRKADCLLLCAQSKNECRMFRIQFGGESKEQMLEHCCSCVQKLAEYLPVQATDEQSQQLYHSLGQLASGENQDASVLYTVAKHILFPVSLKVELRPLAHAHTLLGNEPVFAFGVFQADEPLPDSCFGERRSVAQLAQSVLKKKSELPLVYRHSVWRAQELGPFIRLCLMDQNFPAFVEEVEKELKKLTEG
ncbi:meiotic recombination protein REC114 [Pterocles gutturalis]